MQTSFLSYSRVMILTAPTPTFRQELAANELRRGLWQLGFRREINIAEVPGLEPEASELRFVLLPEGTAGERYTIAASNGQQVSVSGESDLAVLYGVFDFLERQGAFFGLDGDLYPLDTPTTLTLPDANQPWQGRATFQTRGTQPWPDFLNGITAYNREDFRAYLEAMLRMRLNTLSLHVYGQNDNWAESFHSFEYGGIGFNAFLDSSATSRWGYLPQRTSRFGMGAAQYFDGEVFGSDATRFAHDCWEEAERAQALWQDAFAYADKLGIRVGAGFEPFQLPDEIVRACPSEVRTFFSHKAVSQDGREYSWQFTRIDPNSRNARYILETRLAALLETYPPLSYIVLWEDEASSWISHTNEFDTLTTPYAQAHDFLRRHAPRVRLVVAGWGGITRQFEQFHRQLPVDVIFAALNDQFGWDPPHPVFGKLEERERWAIPWIEDDPAVWFPQLRVSRMQDDLKQARALGCQGVLGAHWRHRIVDPVAGYLARASWNADSAYDMRGHYRAYARTQAHQDRADRFADWLHDADTNRRLISTWTGNIRADGHAQVQELSGDYGEAFIPQRGWDVSDSEIENQAAAIEALDGILSNASTPLEQERLGYWYGQMKFLDPYARAWKTGKALLSLISEHYEQTKAGAAEASAQAIREDGIPIWLALLGHVRDAVLALQHTIATRNDLGMLVSVHNKLIRIATFRMGAAFLEFLDELPPEAVAARDTCLAPDTSLRGTVIVPTHPSRLSPGESVCITAIAPGLHELTDIEFRWCHAGTQGWHILPMRHTGRRTYTVEFTMPQDDFPVIEYCVKATFASNRLPLTVTAPPEGNYLITG